ncbi:MAG TPA: hypothetical protein PK971_15745, partial [Saprospiraceae bacterium]|nr:hypothetical protein [Saprospiraceae bacterium]
MPVYSQPGVYTITLSISNGLCGTATATRTFTVSAIPEADVTTTYNGGPRCLPLTLDFGLATLPGVTYERSIQRLPDPSNPAGPAPFTYLSGGPNTAAASVRINDCGIYDFTLSARNDCDTLTWTKRDTFYKAPVLPLPLLSDSAFCQSAKLNFTGKTLDTGCDPSATIAWQFPGGMPPTSSDPNPTVMYSSPDSTRSFTLTATATNGCTSVVATRSFTIDAPEKLTLGAASYSLCKDGAPITLSGQPGGGQWFWKNAPVSATFDPAQYPVGLHTLVYRKGSGACTSQDSISIAVKPLPSVNAGPDDTVCIEKQTLALVAIEPASGGTWSCVEKPAAVTGNIFDLGIAGGGTFTLRLQFTDTATTCSNLDERQVTVLGNTAIQPHDTLYCMVPGTLVNLPLHDLPGLLYFGPAVVQPGNRLNPTFYPKDTVVQVFFTLTNAAGCAYTASI